MVRAWHGRGMASVNQTRPHCVNQMGMTHSKSLAARHGRGMLCVNRPLRSRIILFSRSAWWWLYISSTRSWLYLDEAYYTYGYIAGTPGTRRLKKNIGLTGAKSLRPIHTMRHVSVPSPFHLRSVRMVCVHTVRRVQSPSTTAHDRRPAIISIKYAAHCHGMHFQLFINY
jgi:hypothetical protein